MEELIELLMRIATLESEISTYNTLIKQLENTVEDMEEELYDKRGELQRLKQGNETWLKLEE